mgnify:CR=1 FL=1
MRIGIVCYPTYGGSGVLATELGKSLADTGHQVHFITYTQPVRLEHYGSNLYFHEVNVVQYPLFEYPNYELALISKLIEVARNQSLDVLHVHYAIPHAMAAYMARQILASEGIRLPVVTTLHGTDISLVGKDPAYVPSVTFSINQSNVVTAVSRYLRDDTYQHFSVNRKIEVVPNFIDTQRFYRRNMEHFKRAIAPENEFILVHISNFRKVKRIPDIIYTFAEIRKKVNAKLLLAGDGPERSTAEKLCRELGLCEEMRFLGKISAVEELLSVGDLFFLPSETESFGLSALEAMACGVPVIASNAGGLPEVVEHGQSGFIAEVGDVPSMAAFALSILEDTQTLEKFRIDAVLRARQFELSRIRPLYEHTYEEAMEDTYSLS